jgi:hypothetical protein
MFANLLPDGREVRRRSYMVSSSRDPRSTLLRRCSEAEQHRRRPCTIGRRRHFVAPSGNWLASFGICENRANGRSKTRPNGKASSQHRSAESSPASQILRWLCSSALPRLSAQRWPICSRRRLSRPDADAVRSSVGVDVAGRRLELLQACCMQCGRTPRRESWRARHARTWLGRPSDCQMTRSRSARSATRKSMPRTSDSSKPRRRSPTLKRN